MRVAGGLVLVLLLVSIAGCRKAEQASTGTAAEPDAAPPVPDAEPEPELGPAPRLADVFASAKAAAGIFRNVSLPNGFRNLGRDPQN